MSEEKTVEKQESVDSIEEKLSADISEEAVEQSAKAEDALFAAGEEVAEELRASEKSLFETSHRTATIEEIRPHPLPDEEADFTTLVERGYNPEEAEIILRLPDERTTSRVFDWGFSENAPLRRLLEYYTNSSHPYDLVGKEVVIAPLDGDTAVNPEEYKIYAPEEENGVIAAMFHQYYLQLRQKGLVRVDEDSSLPSPDMLFSLSYAVMPSVIVLFLMSALLSSPLLLFTASICLILSVSGLAMGALSPDSTLRRTA